MLQLFCAFDQRRTIHMLWVTDVTATHVNLTRYSAPTGYYSGNSVYTAASECVAIGGIRRHCHKKNPLPICARDDSS